MKDRFPNPYVKKKNPNDSNYLLKVLRLVKRIYNSGIKREVSVHKLTDQVELSDHLQEVMEQNKIHLKKLKVDIYVKHQVAIEVQGEQHDQVIKFSNEQLHPEEHLKRRKLLDSVKQEALLEAGVPLVCVWYDEIEDLDCDKLAEKIGAAQTEVDIYTPKKRRNKVSPAKWRISEETTAARVDRLERGRAYRRQQYLNSKIYLKRVRNDYQS